VVHAVDGAVGREVVGERLAPAADDGGDIRLGPHVAVAAHEARALEVQARRVGLDGVHRVIGGVGEGTAQDVEQALVDVRVARDSPSSRARTAAVASAASASPAARASASAWTSAVQAAVTDATACVMWATR
jgi:hypothetical protein